MNPLSMLGGGGGGGNPLSMIMGMFGGGGGGGGSNPMSSIMGMVKQFMPMIQGLMGGGGGGGGGAGGMGGLASLFNTSSFTQGGGKGPVDIGGGF
ncbi:MAG TPA: hypothetical protein VND93_22660 [Myxococcales bacterium]|nr:hypothetical protein [Myxococcales bacterium]